MSWLFLYIICNQLETKRILCSACSIVDGLACLFFTTLNSVVGSVCSLLGSSISGIVSSIGGIVSSTNYSVLGIASQSGSIYRNCLHSRNNAVQRLVASSELSNPVLVLANELLQFSDVNYCCPVKLL